MQAPQVARNGNPRAFTFLGGAKGSLSVISHATLAGPPIAPVPSVEALPGCHAADRQETLWSLTGVSSNDRYTTRAEKTALTAVQQPIGRREASHSALILLRKNEHWWALTQDERRAILEEKSHHIAIGMQFLPAIARRLLHCRDIVQSAEFDFIGYLDFAPDDAGRFDDMLGMLRATEEWTFIDRETDIRLVAAPD